MEGAIMSARTTCVILMVLATTGIGPSTKLRAGGAQQGTAQGEWTRYGGDPGSTKYAPLDQIDKSNISQLAVAWRRPAKRSGSSSRFPTSRRRDCAATARAA
jgi:quinoprotein glucose dehydrogenase